MLIVLMALISGLDIRISDKSAQISVQFMLIIVPMALISGLDILISDIKRPNIRSIPALVSSPNIRSGYPDIG